MQKINRLSLWQWLLLAAGLYALATFLLYWLSVWNVFPGFSLGQGFWEFSVDSAEFYGEALAVAERLTIDGPRVLFQPLVDHEGTTYGYWYSYWHIKLYAVMLVLLGTSPLSVLPLQTLLCSGILIVFYRIGSLLWSRRAAFWSTALVAVWPSALLHMTQLSKDPFYIFGQFLSLYGMLLLVRSPKSYPIRRLFGALLSGGIGIIIIYMIRPNAIAVNWGLWVLLAITLMVRSLSMRTAFGNGSALSAILITVVMTHYTHNWLPIPSLESLLKRSTNTSVAVVHQPADIPAAKPAAVYTLPTVGENILAPAEVRRTEGLGPKIAKHWQEWKDQTRARIFAVETRVKRAAADVGLAVGAIDAAAGYPVNRLANRINRSVVVTSVTLSRLPVQVERGMDRISAPLVDYASKRREEWLDTQTGSLTNIDTHVRFDSIEEIIDYLPRAFVVGLFTPFPDNWWAEGRRVGRAGRLIAGAETLVFYFIFLLALPTLARSSRRLEVWVLVAVSGLWVTALGALVPNEGAIFRIRYAFLFMWFFPATQTAVDWSRRRRKQALRALKKTIVRIVTRTNVGGPALHTTLLTQGLAPDRYRSWLVRGQVDEGEEDYMLWQNRRPRRLIDLPQLQKKISIFKDLQASLSLFSLIRRLRPDIVHTHMAKAGLIGRLAAKAAGVPVIIHTYHGHVLKGYFPKNKERFYTLLERWLARFSTTLITVSETVKNELLEMKIGRAEQYRVIPLGLNLDRYLASAALRGRLKQELGFPEQSTLISLVGRLVPIKRQQDFIEAAQRILVDQPDAQFLLVGDGEDKPRLQQQVRRLNLTQNVHFLGWRRDLDRIYADTDVVVLTSDNEGLPVSIIEAMASGCPVVATKVGGVGDLVEDQQTGVLVKPRDIQALAEAVKTLTRSKDLAGKWGQTAQRLAKDRYGAERLVRDIDNLYSELLGHSRKGGQ